MRTPSTAKIAPFSFAPIFLLLLACSLLAIVAPTAWARDDDDLGGEACSHDLKELLSGVTIFGVASWGENWVEYHNPDGTSVLSNINLRDAKRGTWSSDNCLEVCYGYADGNGWCPEWRQVEGGWVNVRPGTDQIVHQIYLLEEGDVMGLEDIVNREDLNAGRI